MHREQPHCALIVGKTNSGKTKWILDLVETEYRHRFEAIVIICPTLFKNKTYLSKRRIYTDDQVYLCDLDRERLTLNEAIDLSKTFLMAPGRYLYSTTARACRISSTGRKAAR